MACGTGIWTAELLKIADRITAIDTCSKLASASIKYLDRDLFRWRSKLEYNLVFFSFWLSHVPPDFLEEFLRKVYKSVRSLLGKLFIIDSRKNSTSTAKNHILNNNETIFQKRKLNDDREFQIIKIFYELDFLKEKLDSIGFNPEVKLTENYFIYAAASKK